MTTENLTVADVLERAADLIEPEGAWTQGYFARDDAGQPVEPGDPSAVCFCALGAVQRAAGGNFGGVHTEAVNFLRANLPGFEFIDNFNDDFETTQPEVVSVIRKAAAHAREQSNG